MSWQGLDWGSGLGQFSQILRDAYVQKQREEQFRQQLEMQYYEPFLYSEMEGMDEVPMQGMPAPGPNTTLPPDQLERYYRENPQQPAMVSRETGAPIASPGMGDFQVVPKSEFQWDPRYNLNQYSVPVMEPIMQEGFEGQAAPIERGPASMSKAKTTPIDLDPRAQLQKMNEEKRTAPLSISQVYDNEIQSLVRQAKKMGFINERGMVHKSVAAQIRNLQMEKAKALAKTQQGDSFQERLILGLLSQEGLDRRQQQAIAARPPGRTGQVSDVQKGNALLRTIPPQPRPPTLEKIGMFEDKKIQMQKEERNRQKEAQYEREKAEWEANASEIRRRAMDLIDGVKPSLIPPPKQSSQPSQQPAQKDRLVGATRTADGRVRLKDGTVLTREEYNKILKGQ